MDNNNQTIWWIFGGCALFFTCIACLGMLLLFGGFAFFTTTPATVSLPTIAATLPPIESTAVAISPTTPTPTPDLKPTQSPEPTATFPPTPTSEPTLALPIPTEIEQRPISAQSQNSLIRLLEATYPPHDYYEVAQSFGDQSLGPRTVIAPTYQLGDNQTFATDDGQTVDATLLAITEHAYFWVDDTLTLNETAVSLAAERFANDYYPAIENLFGDVTNSGIDDDPRFTILHLADAADSTELGYFTDVNQYPRTLYSDSNEQEMLYLNMNYLDIGEDLYFGTLVHEIQHVIQWQLDSNETTWLNEGLSQLGEIYVDLDTADTIDYLQQPDIQLNRWEYENEESIDAHYAGAYLFLVYLWEQLGEEAIKELTRHPANGMAAIHNTLKGFDPLDRSLTQFMGDWAVANYMDDVDAGKAYHYQNLNLERPSLAATIHNIPDTRTTQLNQFSVDYIDLDVNGPITLTFAGNTIAPLTDPPQQGEQIWFSPALDNAHHQLSTRFDLSDVSRASLKFNAWYDLEPEWDFAYLSISTDNGQTWQFLSPDHPSVGDYGPAFNGRSHDETDSNDGWVKETISLNDYVGQSVTIRFDVLTDSAIAGNGFAIDDIIIPELNYEFDVESDTMAWQADGFVQTSWYLPQQWQIQLITLGADPEIIPLPLNSHHQTQLTLDIDSNGRVLAITTATPFITQPATYWLDIQAAK